MDIKERFFKYISFDTKSDESSTTIPSTKGQLELGRYIVEELKGIGLTDAKMDNNGYIIATIPSNIDKKVPVIGFIAHMDTSPDLDGKVTNPKVVEYKGGDIKLNDQYTMTEEEFPELKGVIGETLIMTDGTTLLGADDKAGITEIVSAAEYLMKHPEIKHGEIKIGFTPDEEIGRGADKFQVEEFGADFAYTLDGGPIGELEYENFNAATAKIKIQGKNVHPGSAKDTMINSQLVGMELHSLLPVGERPEHTEKYEGFSLLTAFNGAVDYSEMTYIIRDHSREKFEAKKKYFEEIVKFLNIRYKDAITLEIKDSYYNMREKVEPMMHIVELAKKSMEEIGITPNIKPIRGGTDGSRLSYMGLVTPNIFAGGYNFHSRFEFVPLSSIEKATELIVKIVENNAKDNM